MTTRYNDLVAGLHHYMLDSKLITKMDTMLNNSVVHKVNNMKKQVNTNPQQWEYTKKDQTRMSRQKERFYFPKETDQLFWMFFIFQNGNDIYELTDTSKFLVEKEKKMDCIVKIRENKKQLASYKIKGIKDTVEDDLVNSKQIDIKTFFALCITHNMNIMYIHKQKYYELKCDPDNQNPPLVIHRIDVPTLKYGYELDITPEKVNAYKETHYSAHSFLSPLKCISSYKVSDLRDICKKVNIEEELFIKKTKPQLYQLIIDTI
jgi:hypothetical protein